jgi:membrane-bound lytic murein transglycosylase D
MKSFTLIIILIFQFPYLMAQGPVVSSDMRFADIRLKINEAARREIQEDVDAITQSPKYFNQKVKRARLYFPIIERILAEENVPDDIKYLVIQESALISDAVSSSNAVGYWQFKDFTAIEMGLRVDNHIDERMNIVSATHAAAKYFKKNNFYFDNWLFALQAYQMGAGAAMKVLSESDRGAKSLNITKKTYWYVKKYLAHKVAYGYALEQNSNMEQRLVEYTRGGAKSLRDISKELMVEETELYAYNKWLKKGKIPEDKIYAVIVPVSSGAIDPYLVASSKDKLEPAQNEQTKEPTYDGLEDPDRFPVISENKGIFSSKPQFVSINGIPGVIGKEGQTTDELAKMAGIEELKFTSYNEMLPHESITADQVYYFKKKKTKAKVHYHTVQYDETLWDISQKYGVRVSKLLKKNRLKDAKEIEAGMVLWLRYIRPSTEEIAYKEVKEIIVASELVNNSDNSENEVEYIEKYEQDLPVMTFSPPNLTVEDLEQQETESKMINITHKVEAKETLYSISKIYSVEVMDIVNWNKLNIADGLQIGQILELIVDKDWQTQVNYLEEKTSVNMEDEGFIEHRVQVGDTMYAIANKYGVTVEDIQAWNDKEDTAVTIGERIWIKP